MITNLIMLAGIVTNISLTIYGIISIKKNDREIEAVKKWIQLNLM